MFPLALALFAAGARAIQPYGHAFGVTPNDFSPTEYSYIASTFPIFTVEKRHAMAVYGDPSAPAFSPFRYNSIAASVGTARKIKALNPAARVLMYWNSALHWNFYEVRLRSLADVLRARARPSNTHAAPPPSFPPQCEAAVQPSWLLPPSHGLDVPSYNYANAAFRAWWVACAVGALANSSGALDGLFVDAAPKLSWAGQPADAFSLWGGMLDAVRAASPAGTFLVFNGDFNGPSGVVGRFLRSVSRLLRSLSSPISWRDSSSIFTDGPMSTMMTLLFWPFFRKKEPRPILRRRLQISSTHLGSANTRPTCSATFIFSSKAVSLSTLTC
jgi:hypothetical protein